MKRKLHLLSISWAVCLAGWLGSALEAGATTPNPISTLDCQLSVTLIPQHVSCNGAGDGVLLAQIVDENDPPMLDEVLWSTGEEGVQSIQGLVPGTYSVTVTNTDECVVVETIEITEPGELGSVVLSIEHVACAGTAGGAVTFTAFGGTPPYTYTTDQGVFVVNGGDNLYVENILAGSYAALVEDFNGCSITSSYTVNEPEPLVGTFVNVEGVLCPDDATGTAEIGVEGGTAPYSYQWSNGDTTALADSLPVGLVTVVIRDANDCLWQDHVAISILDTEPPTVVVATGLTVYLDDQGLASLSPEAVDGGSFDNCTIESMSLDLTSFDCTAQGLQTVVLTVADQVGNAASALAEIEVLDTIPPTLILPNDTILYDCNGYFEYEVLALDNCGTLSPFLVDGLPGGSNFPLDLTVINTWAVEDSPAGNSAQDSFEVTVLNTLEGAVTMIQSTCPGQANGSAMVEAVGGTPPYSYQWQDMNAQTGPTASGLPAAPVTVGITDSLDCFFELPVLIDAFPAISIPDFQVDNENSGAGDGAITIIVDGEGPFSFVWLKNGAFFADQQNILGLSAGTYIVEITDVNGCLFTSGPFVVQNISGTTDIRPPLKVRLFPNPASTFLYVEVEPLQQEEARVEMYSMQGQVLPIDWQLVHQRQIQVNLKNCVDGMYLLRIIVGHRETWQWFTHVHQ